MRKEFRKPPVQLNWIERPPSKRKGAVSSTAKGIPQKAVRTPDAPPLGIKFSNNPDMKRILLPEDWEGYPLKKDYKVADYYHGMHIPKDKTDWE